MLCIGKHSYVYRERTEYIMYGIPVAVAKHIYKYNVVCTSREKI